MKNLLYKFRLLIALVGLFTSFEAGAISLWVGESYEWDFSSSIMGSTYNMRVTSNGGYLSITGSGFYRRITPTQYFSGTATITAEWDYTLYYGGTMTHTKRTLTVTCNENPVSIYPTSITLSPGQTYQLSYSHAYSNQYVSAANAYFSGGNSSFSVSSSGLVTAKSPGSGYVNVYSKVSNAANAPYCHVTVKDVEPTGASISNISLFADASKDLSVTVSPSNATVKSKNWYVKSGNDVVSISGQRITGLKPGTATIYCMVNGSVRSNDATVTVKEPGLTINSTSPETGASEISVFTVPTVNYSHTLYKGDAFNSIALTAAGNKVDGTTELSDRAVRFLPSKPLKPHTSYRLVVPRNAVKNKWGSPVQGDATLSFTTGALEKAKLEMKPESGSYLTKDDKVTITSIPSDAIIYYTTDGATPTTSSRIYSGPIEHDGDMTVKAFAVREGYEDSDIATAQYYKSNSEIIDYFPNDSHPLYNYAWAAPYLKLSGTVLKSSNFRRISLTNGAGEDIPGEAYIANYIVVFVPDKPLENSTEYTMDIPRDALKTSNGEVFKGFSWKFTTRNMTSAIAMQGDESVYLLSEDGNLRTRGLEYLTTTPSTGSFTFNDLAALKSIATGVDDVDGGFTHSLLRKGSSVSSLGLTFCHEGGTSSSANAISNPLKTFAGFQTSAVIAEDNSLWLCGRNDFYQLGDKTGTTSSSFIKIADNVIDVALGNGYTLYVDSDNNLYGVGRNHRGQLGNGTTNDLKTPAKIMDGVAKVYASSDGYFSACITVDGKLMTWGDNSFGQLGRVCNYYSATPAVVMDNVASASLGQSHTLAIKEDCKLYSWGSNASGQIAKSGTSSSTPLLMDNNIMAACAGPNTSLVLAHSGKVTGWGKITHQNFSSGSGKASGIIIDDGVAYSSLTGVRLNPIRFEAKPEYVFALATTPVPYSADFESVEWGSSNPGVATVDEKGVITTRNNGEATITVTLSDRYGNRKNCSAVIVCTDNPDNSGISNAFADASDWIAYTDGCRIIIEDAAIGDSFSIYNTQGILIGSSIADNERISFSVDQPGVYIVKSNNKVAKVICE